jgi:hypothetical protein
MVRKESEVPTTLKNVPKLIKKLFNCYLMSPLGFPLYIIYIPN